MTALAFLIFHRPSQVFLGLIGAFGRGRQPALSRANV